MEEKKQQPVITIRCTPALHKALKQLAFDNQISMNSFICELLIKECHKAGHLEANHENTHLRTPVCNSPPHVHPNGQQTDQETHDPKTNYQET